MNGRSTTSTDIVSLVLRPSVAYTTKSASSGPSETVAESPARANEVLRHELPVTRWASVIIRRPGALTVNFTFSPRNTDRGASLSVTPPNKVPFHALSGCSIARQPSGAADAALKRARMPTLAASPPRAARRATRRRSSGASVPPRITIK